MSEEFRVDLHVKILDEGVVERAKRQGLDALVYAPHFERLPAIREQAKRHSDDELLVVPGREVFTGDWRSRKHVLAVGLDEPVPDFLTLDGAMREFERQDAAVLVPHPEFLTVSLSADDIEEYGDTIDAVEVYNPKHLSSHNERAQKLADETALPPFTSSYAHLRGTVGEAWTAFDEGLSDESGLVDALKTGAERQVLHRDGLRHALRCRTEASHLLYENTWKKIDRLLLSGVEATHPSQPVYDGRFDDVAVY